MPWGTGGADRLGKAVTAQAAVHIHVQVGTLVHMQQCMGSAQSKHKLTLGLPNRRMLSGCLTLCSLHLVVVRCLGAIHHNQAMRTQCKKSLQRCQNKKEGEREGERERQVYCPSMFPQCSKGHTWVTTNTKMVIQSSFVRFIAIFVHFLGVSGVNDVTNRAQMAKYQNSDTTNDFLISENILG